jgi:hypothetical protein
MKELILPKVAERDSRAPGLLLVLVLLVFSSKRSSDEMNPNSMKHKSHEEGKTWYLQRRC